VTVLKGYRAVVIGGAQGIGASICRGLSDVGASVAIVDRQEGKAHELANELNVLGYEATVINEDICTKQGCQRVIETAVQALGGLDILVNCAAPSRNRSTLGKISDADWDVHSSIVLESVVFLAESAASYLAKGGCGAIINVSSTTSTSIAIDQCSWPYHVSKAGLNHLTRWLAVRLGEQGIRVNAIAPGLVDRDSGPKLTDNPQHDAIVNAVVPLKRAGKGTDIAAAVVFLSSRQSSYISGQVLTVDGGLGINDVFGASLRALKTSID
jgi:glucose 1-dehydrogenase